MALSLLHMRHGLRDAWSLEGLTRFETRESGIRSTLRRCQLQRRHARHTAASRRQRGGSSLLSAVLDVAPPAGGAQACSGAETRGAAYHADAGGTRPPTRVRLAAVTDRERRRGGGAHTRSRDGGGRTRGRRAPTGISGRCGSRTRSVCGAQACHACGTRWPTPPCHEVTLGFVCVNEGAI